MIPVRPFLSANAKEVIYLDRIETNENKCDNNEDEKKVDKDEG